MILFGQLQAIRLFFVIQVCVATTFGLGLRINFVYAKVTYSSDLARGASKQQVICCKLQLGTISFGSS